MSSRLLHDTDPQDAPFVGRQRNLSRLFAAFEVVRMGRTVAAYVSGPSGIGKTALLQRFLRELSEQPDVLVLAGRCYERVAVPYRALDPLMSQLADELAALPRPEVDALLPSGVRALAGIFPALDRVPAVQALPPPAAETPDPQERRQRASKALRGLLDRLARRGPVVLVVDDLHWGDLDSGLLLVELLRPPHSPPVLLVGSYRSEAAGTSPILTSPILKVLLDERADDGPVTDVRGIELGPLSDDEIVELVCKQVGGDDERARRRARLVARESGGNPYLATELARHWVDGGVRTTSDLTLDQVLTTVLDDLSDAACRLLEVLSVAGRPVAVSLAARAVGGGDCTAALAELLSQHLVSVTGGDGEERVELYHGRLREVLSRRLPDERTAELHRSLAEALEAGGEVDPRLLLDHLLGAGELERAAECAATLARQASEALAFGQAAELYEQAIELGAGGSSQLIWRRELAESLVNAGRGAEAARVFLAAAETAEAADRRELERRAAEQLLRTGHVDEGLRLLERVLDAVGLRLTRGPRRAVLLLLFRQLRLRLRGLDFVAVDEAQLRHQPSGRETLARIDACWSGAVGLGLVDSIRGAELHARGLLLALEAGEPYRVARGLAIQIAYMASAGGRQRERARRLAIEAVRLAEATGHPHAIGLVLLARGMTEFFDGKWPQARRFCDAAEEQLRERCVGATWEMNAARIFGMGARYYMGDLAELCERVPRLLKEHEDRGDLFASASLRADVPNIIWLASDEPDRGRREIDEAMAAWSRQGFHIQHYWRLLAETRIDLYEGDGRAAWDRVDRVWKLLERSLLLRVQTVRVFSTHLRARAALAAARRSSEPWLLLSAARRDVKRLLKEGLPVVDGLAHLVEAGILRAEGDLEGARGRLQLASRELGEVRMELFRAAAQRRLGELIGGEQGERLVKRADDMMLGQRIRQPSRMTDMLAPGVFAVRGS